MHKLYAQFNRKRKNMLGTKQDSLSFQHGSLKLFGKAKIIQENNSLDVCLNSCSDYDKKNNGCKILDKNKDLFEQSSTDEIPCTGRQPSQFEEVSLLTTTKDIYKNIINSRRNLENLQVGIESRMTVLCSRISIEVEKMATLQNRLDVLSAKYSITFNEMLNDNNKMKYILVKSCLVFEEIDKLIGTVQGNMFDYVQITTELNSNVESKIRELLIKTCDFYGNRFKKESKLVNSNFNTRFRILNQDGNDDIRQKGTQDCIDVTYLNSLHKTPEAQTDVKVPLPTISDYKESYQVFKKITSYYISAADSRKVIDSDLSRTAQNVVIVQGQIATVLLQSEELSSGINGLLFKNTNDIFNLEAENYELKELAEECKDLFRYLDFLCQNLMKNCNLYAYLIAFKSEGFDNFMDTYDTLIHKNE